MVLNLTAIHIMANTNKSIHNKEDYVSTATDITELFRDTLLGDPYTADRVFGMSPWVSKVIFKSFGVEMGNVQHRAHAHMVVEIYHSIPKYNIGKLRGRLLDWLNTTYGKDNGGSTGWNVWIKLAPRYQENYANKEERWARNDDIEDINHSEKQRLEDERNMEIITRKMKDIRVLQGNEDQIDDDLKRKYNK